MKQADSAATGGGGGGVGGGGVGGDDEALVLTMEMMDDRRSMTTVAKRRYRMLSSNADLSDDVRTPLTLHRMLSNLGKPVTESEECIPRDIGVLRTTGMHAT